MLNQTLPNVNDVRQSALWAVCALLLLSLSCNTVTRMFRQVDTRAYETHMYDGRFFSGQGQYDRAIEEFTKAIAIDPDSAEAYYSRGLAYIMIEDYASAVKDYDKAIELDPSAVAYNNRCWSYYKMGEYEQALPDCERSLQLNPDDVHALDSRARVYQALGRTEDAIQDFDRIIELGADPELSRQAAEELAKLKDK